MAMNDPFDPACPPTLIAFDPRLAERVRSLAPTVDLCADGAFVLYWMRTAVRLDDNPALDAAKVLAASLQKPLLVYLGIDERYPFASDRHHTFMLQGARDVVKASESQGLRVAFHLARPADRGRHLQTLSEQACAVVTEDFPLAPLSRLTRQLSKTLAHKGVPLFVVDTACTVPMRLSTKRCDRAFAFKKQIRDLLRERLGQTRKTPPTPPVFDGELPFLSLSIADADDATLAQWVGECAIDHAVGPVADTPGGMRAAAARFDAFLGERLAKYHRRRNDPLDREGVSEMSPYFHYGHYSPMRAAALAETQGGDGPDKYVDELIHWRELAYHFCFHLEQAGKSPESFDAALPKWAQESLRAHADDDKQALCDEVLHRARTNDRLWDACQRSLLRHGRLHNNVRMTWGKATLQWSATPEEALARTIALNHRFALDGRDPASFGGILWCFGQFDRPHRPDAKVLGKVRPRPTESHGKRIGVAAFEQMVAAQSRKAVAIVGAGLAGLAAGQALKDAGHEVALIDKGQRPGGRCSTRSDGDGTWSGDIDLIAHGLLSTDWLYRRGAPTLKGRALDALLQQWQRQHLIDTEDRAAPPRALTSHLAKGLLIHHGTKVRQLWRAEGGWRLDCAPLSEGGEFEAEALSKQTFDALVVTPPAPQTMTLVSDVAPALSERLQAVRYRPQLSALVFDANDLETLQDITLPLDQVAGPDAASLPPSLVVELGANRGYRRQGRVQSSVVFHLDPASSNRLLDFDLQSLADAFRRGLAAKGITAQTVRVHRWRYAEVELGLPVDCLCEESLVVAGDSFLGQSPPDDAIRLGARNAWLSGTAAAGSLLRRFAIEAAGVSTTEAVLKPGALGASSQA